MNKHHLIKYAKKDLISFCYLNNPNFVCGDHHEVIANVLQRTIEEKDLRIIITSPPRHGKSHLVSENFPAWYLGNCPDRSMILTSYGQELASDFGMKVRNIFLQEFYNKIFNDIKLSVDSKSKKRFNTNRGGSYYAVGRGGAITGRGGNCLLIDDIIKDDKEANSPLIRKQCIEWYKQTLYTRLMKGGSIVVIATRWHEDDLIGYLLNSKEQKHEKWKLVNFPAINDKGEALWDEFFPLNALRRVKNTLGTRNFEALYQQNPRPSEGSLIKRKWLKFYSKELNLQKADEIIQSWDMTFKASDKSDYVVGTVWARFKASYYLIDKVRDRLDFPDTIKAFVNLSNKYPSAIRKLVEAKANGQAIIDTLKNKISGIVAVNPDISKEARVNQVTPLYESGNVFYPSKELAPWIDEHIEEIVAFPLGKFDDSVDSEVQALQKFSLDSGSVEIYNNIKDFVLI